MWTVPGARMKARRGHRVPLADRAMAVLAEAWPLGDGMGPISPSKRSGKAMSNMVFEMLLPRLEIESTVHGSRSSFKDWAIEQTAFPWIVSEAALAHNLGNSTETAYARSDLFDKRRELMQAWADYIAGQPLLDRNHKQKGVISNLSQERIRAICNEIDYQNNIVLDTRTYFYTPIGCADGFCWWVKVLQLYQALCISLQGCPRFVDDLAIPVAVLSGALALLVVAMYDKLDLTVMRICTLNEETYDLLKKRGRIQQDVFYATGDNFPSR